jgi:hypothetical protein
MTVIPAILISGMAVGRLWRARYICDVQCRQAGWPAVANQRFARTEIPFAASKRESAVTKVRSKTLAVAARNESTGSR